MIKEIAKKLTKENMDYDRHKRAKIVNARNYRISTLFEFLQDSEYNLCLNGKRCNSIDDIRKIVALKQFNTYEFGKRQHLSQYYNFVGTDIDIEVITLERWFEYFGIECKLKRER